MSSSSLRPVTKRPSSLASLSLEAILKSIDIHTESLIYLPPLLKEKLLRKIITKYQKYKHLFSGGIMSKLVHRNIKQLDLSLIRVDDGILDALSQCRALTEINLQNCDNHNVSSEGFKRFFEKTPNLSFVDVSFYEEFNDDVLECLVVNCPKLSKLNCEFCSITDKGLKVLAQCNKLMKCLTLSDTQVTGEGIIDAVSNKNWPNMQEFRIDKNPRVTNNVLQVIIENCPIIEILTFYNCGVTDANNFKGGIALTLKLPRERLADSIYRLLGVSVRRTVR